ncbi:MAG: hypothetical protein N2037_11600 [Acidimicrobiales bacterium]|nr:hypothetical protein [Acidimicrobiales bacterium]
MSRDAALAVAATVALLGVFVAALVLAIARRWEPASDWALIETQVADVGTSATPLVGPYSRFNWNHPGPGLFYVLAVPYRILGSWPNSLLVGALAVNAASVIGVARSAWRLGRLPLVLIAVVATAVLTRSLGAGFLIDPWNPYLPLLPLGWYLFIVWEAGRGRRWAWPLALGLGSFAVQAHVGYCLLVAFPLMWAVGSAVLGHPDRSGQPRWRNVAAVTAVVLTVFWIPPLVQQLLGPGRGNLSALWSQGSRFISKQAPAAPAAHAIGSSGLFAPRVVGLGQALGLLAREFSGWAPWFGGPEPRQGNGGVAALAPLWLFVPLAAWVGVAVAAQRSKRSDLLSALGLAATVLLASCGSVHRDRLGVVGCITAQRGVHSELARAVR